MLKDVVNFARQVVSLTGDAQKNKAEVADLR
jgi:hypothetical protein